MLRIRLTVGFIALCAAFVLASAGGAEGVPGELIVAFRSDVPEGERAQILAAAGADQWEQVGLRLRLKLVQTDQVEHALAQLRADPRVEYAELNYPVSALETTPDDPEFAKLWGLKNTGADGGTADADIDADEAWDTTTGSADVVVAVIDTGIDFGHPDLAAAQWTNPGESGGGKETNGVDDDANGYIDDWRGWDFVNDDNDPFDDHGHGTHVAGTIGAVGNNGVGVVGVSWQVKLMALKFLSAGGWGTTADAVEAIRYATAMGAVVTNNSWGGGGFSQSLLDAIEEAGAAGSLFVAAAGNSAVDTDVVAHYPSSYDALNLVSVAATNRSDGRASFSNFGPVSVDLGAPGEQIYSTIPGNAYASFSGTSMATPHVAGAAALAKAAFPAATAFGIKALLLRTVDPIPSMDAIVATEGRLNVGRAVGCAGGPQLWVESPAEGFDADGPDPVDVAVLAGACGVPAGVAVTATVSGSPVTLTTTGNGLYTGSVGPPVGGDGTLVVTATAGGTSDTRTIAAAPDTSAPSAALTSPADGIVARGTVTLAADASDNHGVQQVEFLVDGAVVATDTSAPYTVSWNSTAAADGTRSITARAADAAGNSAVSAARTIRVDNTAPVVTIAAGSALEFSSPEAGVSFECSLDGAAFAPCTSPWSLSTGSHTLRIRATDAAGNVGPEASHSWTTQAPAAAPAPPPAPPPAPGGGGGGGGGGSADLALTGYAAPAEVAVGSTVTVYLRVLNDKTYGVANGVVVEVDLTDGFVLLSTYADRGPGCAEPVAGKLRCHLDWLSSDAPYGNLTIVGRMTAPGERIVSARVEYAAADPEPVDNAVAVRIVVPELVADATEVPSLERAVVVGRQLRLKLVAPEPTTARIRVRRNRHTVLSTRRAIPAGETVLRLALPRRLRAGRYRVVVTLGDGTRLAALVRAR